MHITVQAEVLRAALAQAVTGRDSGGFTYLTHALFEAADGDAVLITTTDSMLTVEQTISARHEGEPAVALKVETLKAAINGLDGDLVLDITPPGYEDGHPTVQLKNGRRRYNIPAMQAGHFAKDDRHTRHPLETDGPALARAIHKVAYAAKEDDMRPSCQGVTLANHGVFATDGRRLATVDIDLPIKPDAGFVLPKKQAHHLVKYLTAEAQIFLQQREDRTLLFEVCQQGLAIRTRVIDAKPLSMSLYDAIFFAPRSADWSAEFVAQDCAVAMSRSAALLGKKFGASMSHGADGFAIAIDGADDEFTASIHGEPAPFGINPRYILDALNSLGGEQVYLYGKKTVHDDYKPILITNKDQDERHYIQQVK